MFQDALEKLSKRSNEIEKYWICGGTSVYKEAMDSDLCHRVYLTKIEKKFECDTFFPEMDESVFKHVSDPLVPTERQFENGIFYKFHVYQKCVYLRPAPGPPVEIH